MSDKTDFKAIVAANLADNTSNAITPAKHREVLDPTLADKVVWADELLAPSLSFKYTRIADNATPTAGKMAFNSAKSIIRLHSTDANGNDLTDLLSLFDYGFISMVETGSTGSVVMKIDANRTSGSVIVLTGQRIIDTLGASLTDCNITLDFTIRSSSASSALTGTQLALTAATANTTAPSSGYFSLSDADINAANHLYLTFSTTNEKSLWDALMNQVASSKTRIIMRPLSNETDLLMGAVNAANVYSGTDNLTVDVTLDATISVGSNGDYTIYSDYVLELFTIV